MTNINKVNYDTSTPLKQPKKKKAQIYPLPFQQATDPFPNGAKYSVVIGEQMKMK